jgi:hypothetical protein
MTYQGRSHLPVDVVGMELNLYFPALSLQPLKIGDSMFLRNVGIDLQIHTAPKHKTSAIT